jgi:predicted  nucleic acid-binding Zn-ribbon protein
MKTAINAPTAMPIPKDLQKEVEKVTSRLVLEEQKVAALRREKIAASYELGELLKHKEQVEKQNEELDRDNEAKRKELAGLTKECALAKQRKESRQADLKIAIATEKEIEKEVKKLREERKITTEAIKEQRDAITAREALVLKREVAIKEKEDRLRAILS